MSDTDYLKKLVRQMRGCFSLEDVEELTFSLDIELDDLPGAGRSAKLRSLVKHLAQREELPDLLHELRQERPSEEWPNIPENYRWETDEILTQGAVAPLSVGRDQKNKQITGSTIDGTVIQGNVGSFVGGDQTTIHGDQVHGDKVGGDKISVGNIGSGSAVAIGRGASTTVSTTNNKTTLIQYQIQKEIAVLRKLLAQDSGVNVEQKEPVKKLAETIATIEKEVVKENPDKKMLKISADGLKMAAVNIGKSLPAVVPIVTRIVQAVSKLLVQ